jgi:hypothetical protein
MLKRHSQTCVEGSDNINPHIGGDELHLKCYNILLPHWDEWSAGREMPPLEKTTLRGIKVMAPIAGKARIEPAKKRDAIWDFFFKRRGKSTVPTFRPDEIELALVIDYKDFESAEHGKKQHNHLQPQDYDDDSDNSEFPSTSNVRSGFISFV